MNWKCIPLVAVTMMPSLSLADPMMPFNLEPGRGLVGVVEIGDRVTNVVTFAMDRFHDIEVYTNKPPECEESVTIILPSEGIIIDGNCYGYVAEIHCYVQTTWTNFQPFQGTLGADLQIGSEAVKYDTILCQFGDVPEVEMKDCLRRDHRAEDFRIAWDKGAKTLWYSTKGIVLNFDPSNTLEMIWIKRARGPGMPNGTNSSQQDAASYRNPRRVGLRE